MKRFIAMWGVVSLVLVAGWVAGGAMSEERIDTTDTEAWLAEVGALVERSQNPEEFGVLLQEAGYEVDSENPYPEDMFLGAAPEASFQTKCVCDIPYPWTNAGGWKLVWEGTIPHDGNAFISMIWGDPNYDLDLVVVVYPVSGSSYWGYSFYKSSNMESISENTCLGNCGMHSPNPLQLYQGDYVMVYAAMWAMYGVSGPMEFSCCGHLEQ